MTAYNCYYLVLYVFVPINVIFVGEDVIRQKYAYEQFGYGNEYTALALLFSYAIFCLGYWTNLRKRSKFSIHDGEDCFSLQDSAYISKIIFLFGVIAMAVHVMQVGGIFKAISDARELRSGELIIESKFLFFKFFSQFLSDAFVLAFVVLIGKKIQKIEITMADKAFLLLAFVGFAYYVLSTAGRRQFIFPVLICYLVYSSVIKAGTKVSLAIFVLIFLVAGLGTMIGSINPDEGGLAVLEASYNIASQGLGDSFIHFVSAQNAHLWQFGFLTDIVNLPRDFFPSQLFGFERSRNMLGETSEFILGYPLAPGVSGEEPLGLHGYLLVNFGYAGMFALFFILGALYKWLHVDFKPTVRTDAVGWLIYWWIVFGFFAYFREGVLLFVLKHQLTWWVTIALLVWKAKRMVNVRLKNKMW